MDPLRFVRALRRGRRTLQPKRTRITAGNPSRRRIAMRALQEARAEGRTRGYNLGFLLFSGFRQRLFPGGKRPVPARDKLRILARGQTRPGQASHSGAAKQALCQCVSPEGSAAPSAGSGSGVAAGDAGAPD